VGCGGVGRHRRLGALARVRLEALGVTFCPGTSCKRPAVECGPRFCVCHPCDCPRCEARTAKAKRGVIKPIEHQPIQRRVAPPPPPKPKPEPEVAQGALF
jgi:hypothetical protein